MAPSSGAVQMFRDIERKLRLHQGHLGGVSHGSGRQSPLVLTRYQISPKSHHLMVMCNPRWRMGGRNREPQLRLLARVFHRVAGDAVSE